MAVVVDESGTLYRSASLPVCGQSNPLTVTLWMYIETISEAHYCVPFSLDDAGTSYFIGQIPTTLKLEVRYQAVSGTSGMDDSGITDDDWMFVAMKYDPANNSLWYGRSIGADSTTCESVQSVSPDETNLLPATSLYVGTSGWDETFIGRLAHVRLWTAALTQSEIEAELVSTTPVRTSELWAAWELVENGNDTSGAGRHLSTDGSVTWAAGPLSPPGGQPTMRRWANVPGMGRSF